MYPGGLPTYLLLITLFASGAFASSPGDEIKKRQAELQTIRDQINEFEQKIRDQQKHEKATLELLDAYDRKTTLVRRLITNLRVGEKELQSSIDKTRVELKRLEDQMAFLRKHYARYVSSVYKTGREHDLELLLSSSSINQFYVRSEYLKRFSEQRRKDADRIQEKRKEIEVTHARLQRDLGEQRRTIAEKGAEEDRLASVVAERKDILVQIRKDKKFAQREIERKLKAAKQLENLISDLIEAEKVRKERDEARIREGKLPQPPPVAGSFESKKGKLRWPVSEGLVVAKYGNQRHPTLKTITQNTGINIAVKAGTPVSTVAEGEVAMITWYPSYGNLLIMNHYNGYRTVYTHLSEIRVVEGQVLREGDAIGTSGEALEGPRLHFELWKDREKQNPEHWLSKQ